MGSKNVGGKVAVGLAASLSVNMVQGCLALFPDQPNLLDQSRAITSLIERLGLDKLDPREQHARLQGLKAIGTDPDLPFLLDTTYRRGRDPDSDLPRAQKIMDLYLLNARGEAGLLDRQGCQARAILALQVKGTDPHSPAVKGAEKPIVLAMGVATRTAVGGGQDVFCSAK